MTAENTTFHETCRTGIWELEDRLKLPKTIPTEMCAEHVCAFEILLLITFLNALMHGNGDTPSESKCASNLTIQMR